VRELFHRQWASPVERQIHLSKEAQMTDRIIVAPLDNTNAA